MIGDIIIACFICAAYFRAAKEYGKNGLAWALVGLASFFIPYFAIPICAAILLVLVGAGHAAVMGVSIAGLVGFVAAVATVVWVYNKLMERAIDAQAALDSQASASRQAAQGSSESR